MGVPTDRPIFISYTESDGDWARWVEWQLRHLGYATEMAGYDHMRGDDIEHRITRAINDCEVTIALLSPAYEASAWCTREWERADQVSKLRQAVIRRYRPTDRFARRSFRTLYGRNADGAAEVLRLLVEGMPRPSTAPSFPEGRPAFPGRERRFKLPALAALGMVVLGAGALIAWRTRTPAEGPLERETTVHPMRDTAGALASPTEAGAAGSSATVEGAVGSSSVHGSNAGSAGAAKLTGNARRKPRPPPQPVAPPPPLAPAEKPPLVERW